MRKLGFSTASLGAFAVLSIGYEMDSNKLLYSASLAKLITYFVFLLCCENVFAELAVCKTVFGELSSWQGSEPNIIIRSQGEIVGIPEAENMTPRTLEANFPFSQYVLRGRYVICPLGYKVHRPSEDVAIAMYCIRKASINYFYKQGNGDGERVWKKRLPTNFEARNASCTGRKIRK